MNEEKKIPIGYKRGPTRRPLEGEHFVDDEGRIITYIGYEAQLEGKPERVIIYPIAKQTPRQRFGHEMGLAKERLSEGDYGSAIELTFWALMNILKLGGEAYADEFEKLRNLEAEHGKEEGARRWIEGIDFREAR